MAIVTTIVWIVIGMLLMGAIVWLAMPAMMLRKRRSRHNYQNTIAELTAIIEKKQDWHVIAVNDYKEKTAAFGKLEPVGSMNICNPRYASQILTDDANRRVTAFMPLSVGVFEDKQGRVYVSQLNVGLMGRMFGGTIAEVMGMAGQDIGDAIKSVTR